MEGGNSRAATYEDVFGSLAKIRWDELKPGVYSTGVTFRYVRGRSELACNRACQNAVSIGLE